MQDLDVHKLIEKQRLAMHMYYKSVRTTEYDAETLTEDGKCKTYNSMDSNFIFRNETVDPDFLTQYHASSETNNGPKYWSMEEGYAPNEMEGYPLRTFDVGIENGFNVYIRGNKDELSNIDATCRIDPMNIKIALHHPAEVAASKKFITFPFNKTITFFLKPKITRTAESLRSYDSSV